jgi:hypothetical protein
MAIDQFEAMALEIAKLEAENDALREEHAQRALDPMDYGPGAAQNRRYSVRARGYLKWQVKPKDRADHPSRFDDTRAVRQLVYSWAKPGEFNMHWGIEPQDSWARYAGLVD